MESPLLVCANRRPDNDSCSVGGRYCCKNCSLVLYCGASCQKSHWPGHRSECKSSLHKATWQPAWVAENRTPAFIGPGIAVPFGAAKYLWGNVPAVDILRLGSNEGETYDAELRLLLAASGDLRNLVKTIADLPSAYKGPLHVTINDRDADIVARNIIILLVSLVVKDVEEAIDCIIHVWYSAFIRPSHLDILRHQIRPLVADVCGKIKSKKPGDLLAKTWIFGPHSLRVVLTKLSWDRLLSFFEVPANLTAQRAHELRTAVTLAEPRRDYRDRHMYCLSPSYRVAFNKFREDGLLLPFGARRDEFQEPNPTFYQTADSWPMRDNADPYTGWPASEVSQVSTGAATADVYGKLFFYLRKLLRSFLTRLGSSSISLRLLQVDVTSLPDMLECTFSRIEVSNISDMAWLGIHETLRLMIPHLQTPIENPHATLITLFMNAVEETLTNEDKMQAMYPNSQPAKRLRQYMPPKSIPTSTFDPEMAKRMLALDLVTSYGPIFDRYSKDFKFREVADFLGAEQKGKHTVIEKWPYRLKLRPGDRGAQEEFNTAMGFGMTGKECYVEWKRVHRGIF